MRRPSERKVSHTAILTTNFTKILETIKTTETKFTYFCFQLTQVISSEENIFESIRCITFLFVHLGALVIGNFAGQEFINCDLDVYQMM